MTIAKKNHYLNLTGELPDEFSKRVTSSVFRTLAKKDDISIGYSGNRSYQQGDYVNLPQLAKNPNQEDLKRLRGYSDSMALRLRYHDEAIHKKLYPTHYQARETYDLLEQIRVEALGAQQMKGVAKNLQGLHHHYYTQLGYSGFTKQDQIPMAEALRLLAYSYCSKQEIPEVAQKAVALWQDTILEKTSHFLKDLAENLDNQEHFSKICRKILSALNFDNWQENDESEKPELETQSESQVTPEGESQDQSKESSGQQSAQDEDMLSTGSDSTGENEGEKESLDLDSKTIPGQMSEEAGGASSQSSQSNFLHNQYHYSVHCQLHDQIIKAEDLCDSDELIKLRQVLDRQLAQFQGLVSRLANRLQRRLMAKQLRSWQFDLEEGILDASRLARIVANPAHSLSFKQEKDLNFRDTIVSLLIDNSGSMRGRPISIAALSADILARTLERCSVKVEILGFTTCAWKGGQARQQWIADGKPTNPGRLNDLRHIIYKEADIPWRRTRRNLGLMLKEGILKENIDGEALLWASSRLMARPEQRRILMVISDGAPVDDSTLSVNDGSYLERHLRDVIYQIEEKSPIELLAIGIGHDVTRYYRKAICLTDVEELGGTILRQLANLFEEDT
jgi:cobaltochelatase CobT